MFDKELWATLIRFRSISSYPDLTCPYCNTRSLSLDHDTLVYRDVPWGACEKLHDKASLASKKEISDTFENNKFFGVLMGLATVYESSQYTWAKFVAFFTCHDCLKNVSAVGTATIPLPGIKNSKGIGIKVEYFSPPVPMFEIVDSTPKSINKELLQAFSHFHSDLTASGAKLRRATEQFCAELGYKNGTLHKRIEEMRASYPKEANWLQSLKFVGNEATHADDIEESDLLNSFEVFEFLLHIFRMKKLEAKVQKTVLQLDAKFKKT